MVVSKKSSFEQESILTEDQTKEQPQLGIDLNSLLPPVLPNVPLMSSLTQSQLITLLHELNKEDVKIHLFKFMHDMQMCYDNTSSGLDDLKR